MDLSPQAIAEVRITLDSFFEAYGRGDLDQVMSYYLKDESLVGLGTGPGERLLGWEEHRAQLEQELSQSSRRQVTMDWFRGGGRGEVAWAAMEGTVRGVTEAGEFSATLRGSFTLVHTDEGWKIVLGHSSVPMAVEENREGKPLRKGGIGLIY